jgi:hypothetical protein
MAMKATKATKATKAMKAMKAMKKCVFGILAAVGMLAVLNVPVAAAQDPGVRFGISIDPEQVYFGGHMESGPLIEELRFRPNIEIGFGSDLTIVGLNGEFVWPFPLQNGDTIYAGAGPAINIINVDAGVVSDTRVEPGFNFLIGYEFEEDFFAELKIGALDSPNIKFGFGYTWR